MLYSRSCSREIETIDSDINRTKSDSIKNIRNLTKCLLRLIKLYGSKIKQIIVNNWLLYLYTKYFEVIIKRSLILSRLNMILNTVMEKLVWTNNKISSYKL